MGLPFIAINLVSVFMFKDLGVSDTQIAFWTSLIMMPWTLKFLWSPFLEMYRTKKFFVLVTELLSGVLFGIVAFSLFFDYFFAISISTMAVIAFSGATHDIACDGVYMAELNKEEQAKYIGVQGAFYNVAKLVANGFFRSKYRSIFLCMDDYFCCDCGNNGINRSLSYKDVAV